MVILALDTASESSSVAVVDERGVRAKAEHVDARGHAEVLTTLIATVLEEAGAPAIDCIVCGVGPGPYTGLRVGIATAQALGLAWQVPVVGICSLDAIAAAAVASQRAGTRSDETETEGEFVVATDARRSEVYWATYSASGVRTSGPFVNRPDEVSDAVRALPWFGTATDDHVQAGVLGALAGRLLAAGVVAGPPVRTLSTHGTDDGSVARDLGAQRLLAPFPLYVRRPDAVEAKRPAP